MADGVFAFDHAHDQPPRMLSGLLGGKGAGLAEMTALGLDVPPGFTIGLPVFRQWRQDGWPAFLDAAIDEQLARVERRIGRRLGDPADPLLLSVRSGGAVSMPGMLDTVLDLGMNDATVRGLAAATGDARFAWDSYQRFLRMYATIVMGVAPTALPPRADEPDERSVADLRRAIADAAGREAPQDPRAQLAEAVVAVFSSWDSDRARAYREREGIPEDAGTAVTVQAMVFGNRGGRSGTGVVFTRDPNTGAPGPYGDYLLGGQGEDVVDGSAKPLPIADLETVDPAVHERLLGVLDRLERHFGHVCDVEFTVEEGRLWLLQTRAGKLSAVAAVRAAVDLAEDPQVDLDRRGALALVPEAVRRRAAADLAEAGRASRADGATAGAGSRRVVVGLGASPGRVGGRAVFSTEAALAAEDDVVLVRPETSPADVVGMSAAVGILTSRGGLASHAAVVARGWGVPAVVGAEALVVGEDSAAVPGGEGFRAGDRIAIDGATGEVWLGEVPDHAGAVDAIGTAALARLTAWATESDG